MDNRVRSTSLRARLVLGLCAVLLPFLLAAAVGVFYLLPALVQPLEEIISEVAQEIEPVRHLQVALLTVAVGAGESPAAEATPIAISSEQSISVTVSIGVAACPANGADEQALISSADKAMYAAKQGGRDRVAAAPDAATP